MHDEFTEHCLELLRPLGKSVRARRMFGGQGIYVDERFVAIIAHEQLYLKADDETRPNFEAAGCAPFRYDKKQEFVSMSYFQPPEEAMESAALMQPWARMALAAALRATTRKPIRKPSKAAPAAGTARSAKPR